MFPKRETADFPDFTEADEDRDPPGCLTWGILEPGGGFEIPKLLAILCFGPEIALIDEAVFFGT